MKKRKIIIISVIVIAFSMVALVLCDRIVAWNASGHIYDNVDSIPHRKVGLILGTSPIPT